MLKKYLIIIIIMLGFTYCQNAYADDNSVIAFQKIDKEHKSLLSVVGFP